MLRKYVKLRFWSLQVQKDQRYVDTYLLIKRLSKCPGTPVISVPHHTPILRSVYVQVIECMHEVRTSPARTDE